jgi:outer membrane protein
MFATSMSLSSKAQEVITLQRAIGRTLANNLIIKQSLLNEQLSTTDYIQAQNNMLPNLNANTQGGYNWGRSQIAGAFAYASSTSLNINGSAQLQITLYQGGQLHTRSSKIK